MPRNPAVYKTVVTSAARAATGGATFTLPVADVYTFWLVCAAGTGTSPTLDVTLQVTPDGGTTWLTAPMRFTQVTTAALNVSMTIPQNRAVVVSTAASTATTGGLLGTTVVLSQTMKAVWTIGGTNPSFTFSIVVGCLTAAT